jgi:hypothetical protein
MPVISPVASGSRAAALSLVTLQAMPCGCVAAVYLARPTVVEVDIVEAKGPHCRFFYHQAGEVISLGVPDLASEEGGEPQA